jgi:hypothetical protein
MVDPDHRRHPGVRAQGHADHPRRRADRHRDPAVLRPPAARPGRRLPPVPGRGRHARPARTGASRRMPRPAGKPQAVVHHDGVRGHGGQDAAHLPGGRQGPAGRDGASPDQPPARLPGLRQGRRVPAAEPGHEPRPADRASTTSSAPSPSRSTSPARSCSTASAASCASAAPASPTRSPATRSSRSSSAARCSRSASTRTSRSRATSPATRCRSARSGALTGAAYRFRSRPFDLVSTPGACEHCASGCALRTDHRRGTVLRRMAINDPEVNEEWNCDKGRWAFTYATVGRTASTPMPLVRERGRRAGRWRSPAAEALAAARPACRAEWAS